MNPSKHKGTAGETAVVRYFRTAGFPMADRQPLRGTRDGGDIDLCPGIVLEVKVRRLPTGFPTAGELATWMAQSAAEKANAGAVFCPLVVKRPGTTDVGRWFAFLTAYEFALLTSAFIPRHEYANEPVMVPCSTLARVLREAGYGSNGLGHVS